MENLFLQMWCNSKIEGVVWKCIYICVLFQWQMVEEPSCALCEFILLKYEERYYNFSTQCVVTFYIVYMHFF